MTIKFGLKSAEIKAAESELRNYANILHDKVSLVLSRLADKGISVAESSLNSMAKYIVFEKVQSDGSVTIVAREVQYILAEWQQKNQPNKTAIVSPLLMSEFGAGQYAVYWEDSQGTPHETLSDGTKIGRGSFPDQKHAFENEWFYMDVQGNWHSSRGFKPGRPLHNAVMEIITQIESTAREVFDNG